MRSIRTGALGGAAVLALLGGCGGKDGGPQPSPAGDLVVTYFQGGVQPGAILLTITGGAVESVSALPGVSVQVAYNVVIPGTTKVLLTGAMSTGDLFKIRVADTTLATSYVARPDQVADNITFALVDPAGHTFTVHR